MYLEIKCDFCHLFLNKYEAEEYNIVIIYYNLCFY